MTNLYTTVVSEIGQYWLAAVKLFNTVDKEVDQELPVVEKLLTEGEVSIATIFPSIGPKAAEVLNASIELLGAVQGTLDGTVAVESQVSSQLAALAPAGYSVVLIKTDVLADVHSVVSKYQSEYTTAKAAVQSVKEL